MNSPVHPQIQRTLAAIVVTDAVGFSKRMSRDEDKALAMINRDLQMISELCDFFEGKMLKTVGDGVLMYFVSAVQAAACAVEIQKTFLGFAASDQKDDHFTHRVGIHLGDIFFNQQDMMGTGVNIAARLEAIAQPGAICMSQVVYDVVKSRLPLDADFLGDLDLKNIAETVSAYSVWPQGMRPDSKEDTTEAVAPIAVTPLNEAATALNKHPNRRRIRKLLYGAHQSAWENNTNIIASIPIKVLLESLIEKNHTLEECEKSLLRIVATLNRQEEYTQVANVITDSLKGFYMELSSGTLGPGKTEIVNEESVEQTIDPLQALYQDIAARLDQIDERLRMKKLLYCLCYDSWESSDERIESIDTAFFVEIIHQYIDGPEEVHGKLKAILMRLNRRAKYSPIANLIFQECKVLYPDSESQISLPSHSTDMEDAHTENTRMNLRKKPEAGSRKVQTDVVPPPVAQMGASLVHSSSA